MRERDWRQRQRAHAQRVEPWIAARAARRHAGAKDPTDDFLFEYYPYSMAKLTTWHPGYAEVLEGAADEFLAHPAYVRTSEGVTTTLDWLVPRRRRLDLAARILRATLAAPAQTGCFALHEWAMVYGLRQEQVRHAALPLRLEPGEIRATVDAVGLRCTHVDAFRFFTAGAAPRNALRPTREAQPELEQPGCLHANMDLYKYAMWCGPFVAGELVADCFEFARQARELDMRASPYDVAALDLIPIPVETAAGRHEFAAAQRDLSRHAQALRTALLTCVDALLVALDCS